MPNGYPCKECGTSLRACMNMRRRQSGGKRCCIACNDYTHT